MDPKIAGKGGLGGPVYFPSDETLSGIRKDLSVWIGTKAASEMDLRPLASSSKTPEPALLYLPYPYVVPGGRFNEMYGWDSYFIVLGLLHDGETEIAKDMANDALYEIRHYGKILNANRTYYLTRSDPPFMTEMVLAVYGKTKDLAWLRKAEPLLERYYLFWTKGPHEVAATGLSRFYDEGDTPAPEVLSAEKGADGRDYYQNVRAAFKSGKMPVRGSRPYYDAKTGALTPFFYRSDRSMRESGFDISERFGPFNMGVLDYNPVGLNALLYRMERDMAEIEKDLGRSDKAAPWIERARSRRRRVDKYMWDKKAGLYYDYDYVRGERRRYPFLTTFYPLWAGMASARQAARVRANLPIFERAGGLRTSAMETGFQWDSPFGWAPLEWISVRGLRRYGYNRAADRISINFLSLVLKEFLSQGTVVEKYDVVRRTSSVGARIKFGYHSNEIGFGWTNAVFELLDSDLPAAAKSKVLRLAGVGIGS